MFRKGYQLAVHRLLLDQRHVLCGLREIYLGLSWFLALKNLEIPLELHISGFPKNQEWGNYTGPTLQPPVDGLHAPVGHSRPGSSLFINDLSTWFLQTLEFAAPRMRMSSERVSLCLKFKTYTQEMGTFRYRELGICGADTAFWLLTAVHLGACRGQWRILSAFNALVHKAIYIILDPQITLEL